MDAAAAISPELALIDPELRVEAVALLPDFEWQHFLVQARLAAQRPEAQPIPTEPFWRPLRALATWMVVAFASASAATLALTLIADSVR